MIYVEYKNLKISYNIKYKDVEVEEIEYTNFISIGDDCNVFDEYLYIRDIGYNYRILVLFERIDDTFVILYDVNRDTIEWTILEKYDLEEMLEEDYTEKNIELLTLI